MLELCSEYLKLLYWPASIWFIWYKTECKKFIAVYCMLMHVLTSKILGNAVLKIIQKFKNTQPNIVLGLFTTSIVQ